MILCASGAGGAPAGGRVTCPGASVALIPGDDAVADAGAPGVATDAGAGLLVGTEGIATGAAIGFSTGARLAADPLGAGTGLGGGAGIVILPATLGAVEPTPDNPGSVAPAGVGR